MDAIVRRAIYSAIVASGRPPTAAELAASLAVNAASVVASYRRLADAHVVVLQPGSVEVAWAPPFSALPTPFRVSTVSGAWHAPCAWDAFGIAAALKQDAEIDARCAWSGEPVACGVDQGAAYGAGVIHLLVPAAHFWDDIHFT